MKDKARLMTTTPIIKIDDEIISVNPQLQFQRLLTTVERDGEADFNEIFKYELSTTPAALFSEKDGLMRKADKSKLSEAVWKFSGESASTLPDKVAYVLDGGSLMQNIQSWPKGKTFKVSAICMKIILYAITARERLWYLMVDTTSHRFIYKEQNSREERR